MLNETLPICYGQVQIQKWGFSTEIFLYEILRDMTDLPLIQKKYY